MVRKILWAQSLPIFALIEAFLPARLALSPSRQTNRRQQVVAAAILEQKPAHAGSKGGVAHRRIDAQHHDPSRWRLMAQAAHQRHAVELRRSCVEQSYSRPKLLRELEGDGRISGRSDHFDIRGILEQANECAADEGITIRDQNSNGLTLDGFQQIAP